MFWCEIIGKHKEEIKQKSRWEWRFVTERAYSGFWGAARVLLLDVDSGCTSICLMISHWEVHFLLLCTFLCRLSFFTKIFERYRIFPVPISGCLKSPSGRQNESKCKISSCSINCKTRKVISLGLPKAENLPLFI